LNPVGVVCGCGKHGVEWMRVRNYFVWWLALRSCYIRKCKTSVTKLRSSNAMAHPHWRKELMSQQNRQIPKSSGPTYPSH